MTDKELIESKILEDKAEAWINSVAPLVFKKLDEAQISYDEEMLYNAWTDAFKIGYATCFRELRGQENVQ